MKDQILFRRIVAISTILIAPLTIASTVILLMSVNFDTEFMSNPGNLITIGATASETFRWGSILELFSTLFLVPIALYLWYWLKPRTPQLVTLLSIFGMISILLGITGELLRTSLYPPLMNAYFQAPELQREMYFVIFQSVTNFNFVGMWALEAMLWGIWWLGIGLVLRRERLILGIFTIILGIALLGAGIGWLLDVDLIARLENVFILIPFWAVWIGIVIWRRVERSEQMAVSPVAD